MKYWKDQIRIPDYSWLTNRKEKRTFCVVTKNFTGLDKEFRVHSYVLLEAYKSEPVEIPYEMMENLMQTKQLEYL